MDVLQNYTTYKRFFGLIKQVENDPDVPRTQAAKALRQYLELHPRQCRASRHGHYRAFSSPCDARTRWVCKGDGCHQLSPGSREIQACF